MPTEAEAPAASYFQILRSTMMIGGSSVIVILFAIVRNKTVAVLLGPEGIGLIGLYTAVLDLAQNTASLGLQSSGVRQIAEASGSGDARRIALTASVLRRSALVLGVAGMAMLVLLSRPIAHLTFGDHADVAGVCLLSLAVFLRLLAGAHTTLLQGMRQISSLARANVVGAIFGTATTIPLIYFWGIQGIVPSLVGIAAISLAVAWVYARRLPLASVKPNRAEARREATALLKLGMAFLASGLLSAAVAYGVRLLVLHSHGAAAAGLYQAAWTLGGLYAGFILQAMSADFYPRLTVICEDNDACNRLVNEQAHIGMLLAGPGLLVTLSLAPLVVELLYSPLFHEAGNVLRWICLGMMLRIIAWPIGFIIVAKGAQTIFFLTEVAAATAHLGLAWLLTPRFGAAGAGAAFFGLYVCHTTLVYCIVRRLSGFRWSAANARLALLLLPISCSVFALFLIAPFWLASAVGSFMGAATGLYCLYTLARLLPAESIPAPIRSRLLRIA